MAAGIVTPDCRRHQRILQKRRLNSSNLRIQPSFQQHRSRCERVFGRRHRTGTYRCNAGNVDVTHPLDLFRLDDTVVVITGASAGLGNAWLGVHAVGATVVISARRQERLEALADELGRTG